MIGLLFKCFKKNNKVAETQEAFKSQEKTEKLSIPEIQNPILKKKNILIRDTDGDS